MKYRVSYTVASTRYACEYKTQIAAESHRADIAGYEGVFDVRVDPIDSNDPPEPGPYKVIEPTRFNREDPI